MSYDIVVLSSSPPIIPDTESPPYSPLHDSPATTPRRVPMSVAPLRSPSPSTNLLGTAFGASAVASKEAPIPGAAIRGFATVGSLVRSEHFAELQTEDDAPLEPPRPRQKSAGSTGEFAEPAEKPEKRSAKTTAAGDCTKPPSKPRGRKPKIAKETTAEDPELRLPAPSKSPFFVAEGAALLIEPAVPPAKVPPKLTKSGKPRKPRTKRVQPDGEVAQPKPRKSKVVKAKATTDTKELAGDVSRVESAHFNGPRGQLENHNNDPHVHVAAANVQDVPFALPQKKKRAAKARQPDPLAEGLNLEEAVSRRRDWTPPRDTTIASPATVSTGKENRGATHNTHFTHMVSNFAFAEATCEKNAEPLAQQQTKKGTKTKRRRVELVDIPGKQTASRHSSPEKGKAPKKKARTITDIATEQYQVRQPSEPTAVNSDFFEPRSTTTNVPLNDVDAADSGARPKKPGRRRSTSQSDPDKKTGKARPRKATAKASKAKPVAEKLLSPRSAMTRVNQQDVLFGTSSQLALPESPTLVRQIQHAIKESEMEADYSITSLLESPPQWPRFGNVRGTRRLWNASTRDDEGGLLEQMADIYMPEADRSADFPLLMDGTVDDNVEAPKIAEASRENVPVLISSEPSTPPRAIQGVTNQLVMMHGETRGEIMQEGNFEDIDDLDFQPPPSNQNVQSQRSFVDIDNVQLPPSVQTLQPPPLSRPPASMPASTAPPKRPGRPPKATSALKPARAPPKLKKSASAPPLTPSKGSQRFIDIEEILDSEDEILATLSPTPPRSRKLQRPDPLPLYSLSPTRKSTPKSKSNASPSKDSELVEIHKIPTSNLIFANIKALIFASITAHIRSLPPTTNPSNPTWHEKILMYTPIILEDFTAYLVTHTTAHTYKKATQKQIKAWNKEQKRLDEDEVGIAAWEEGNMVLAVEKELEIWMVREWCEGLSICCVMAERGRGGARKGLY